MKFKKIFVISISVIIVLVIFFIGFKFLNDFESNKAYIDEINGTKIMNTQQTYIINLKTFEEADIMFVSFYITDNNDTVIYKSNEQWRLMDFHGIKFNEKNDIIVSTGDIGEELYSYQETNDNSAMWYLNDNNL